MSKITLTETRRRTGLDLLPDDKVFINHPVWGRISVREAQRRSERRYPQHRKIRLAAMNYFDVKGYDIYSRGLSVDQSWSCPDFAILRGKKITFIEVLTAAWATNADVLRKARILEHAPLWIVVEKKPKSDFSRPSQYYSFLRRVRRLGHRYVVFWCDLSTPNRVVAKHSV